MKRGLLLIIILLVALLSACNPVPEPTESPIDDPDLIIYDLSYLNYNPEYTNPGNPDEKGFIIYDYIDFNLIRYNISYIHNPYFEIYYCEELIATVQMPEYGTVYPDYRLDRAGEYEIKVNLNAIDGSVISNSFIVNVISGGYPDRVDFKVYDSQERLADTIIAGNTYYIAAEVYCGGEILPEDNDKFTSGWYEIDGNRIYEVTLNNLTEDKDIKYDYRIYVSKAAQQKQEIIFYYTLNVKNNYAGIEIDCGQGFTDNSASLFVTESVNNFLYYFSARHIFTNGETENIPVNYKSLGRTSNTIIPYIKYNGEENFSRYIRGAYDYSDRFIAYNSNNTVYQFDPEKQSAEIRFNYCSIKDGNLIESEIDYTAYITLLKGAPDSIKVTSVYGQQKNENNDYYSFFNNREVISDEVDVKILVKDGYNPEAKQYFSLIIEFTNALMKDYYVEYDTEYLRYNSSSNKFYADKEGSAFIRVISPYSGKEYEFTVNIINPALSYELVTEGHDFKDTPTFFFGCADLEPYIKVVENLYDRTSRKRALYENESIKYFQEGLEISKESLTYQDRVQSVSVGLNKNGEIISDIIFLSFFVLPDLIVTVNSQQMALSEIAASKYVDKKLDNNDTGSFQMKGYIPYIEIENPLVSVSGITSSGEIIDENSFKLDYYTYTKNYKLFCILKDGHGGLQTEYDFAILTVIDIDENSEFYR